MSRSVHEGIASLVFERRRRRTTDNMYLKCIVLILLVCSSCLYSDARQIREKRFLSEIQQFIQYMRNLFNGITSGNNGFQTHTTQPGYQENPRDRTGDSLSWFKDSLIQYQYDEENKGRYCPCQLKYERRETNLMRPFLPFILSLFTGTPTKGSTDKGIINRLASFLGCRAGELLDTAEELDRYPPIDRPPVITCPENIKITADKMQRTVTIKLPSAIGYDPEDGRVTPRVTNEHPLATLPGGQHQVWYEVQDKTGKKDTCGIYVDVKVVSCMRYGLIDNGEHTCASKRVLYGRTCEYKCHPGYEMKGNKIITCQKNGTYDFTPPSCELKSCPTPDLPSGGQKYTCTNNFHTNSQCSLKCLPGYSLTFGTGDHSFYPGTTRCTPQGTWTGAPKCHDSSAPEFTNCPKLSIQAYADKGGDSAIVTWNDVTATDNSDTAHVKQTKGGLPGTRFSLGDHEIRYDAQDDLGNEAVSCVFYIHVGSRTCPPPNIVDPNVDVSCTPGLPWGAVCNFTCRFGLTMSGSSSMSCELVGSEQMEWRLINGPPKCEKKSCDIPAPPPNGRFACDDVFFGGKMCFLECNKGYTAPMNFDSGKPIVCTMATGVWEPAVVPGCVALIRPETLILPVQAVLKVKEKCDDILLGKVEEEITNFLMEDAWYKNCEHCDFLDVKAFKCRRRRRINLVYISWKFTVPFVGHKEDIADDKAFYYSLLKKTVNTFKNGLKKNASSLAIEGSQYASVRYGRLNFQCKDGLKPNKRAFTCAGCSPGTFYDAQTEDCKTCSIGYYQDKGGSIECNVCPSGSTTLKTGATSSTDCKKTCIAGYYSPTGLAPCAACPKGWYQSSARSKGCRRCPSPYTTDLPASIAKSQCTVKITTVPPTTTTPTTTTVPTTTVNATLMTPNMNDSLTNETTVSESNTTTTDDMANSTSLNDTSSNTEPSAQPDLPAGKTTSTSTPSSSSSHNETATRPQATAETTLAETNTTATSQIKEIRFPARTAE